MASGDSAGPADGGGEDLVGRRKPKSSAEGRRGQDKLQLCFVHLRMALRRYIGMV